MVEATSMATILDGQTGGMSISEMLNTQKDELEEFGTTITSKLMDMMRAVTNSPPPTTDAIEMPDVELLRMLEQPLSPLTVLSISAIITTISLFFCGIPICMQIYRRRSTHEISGFPFLMGFLGEFRSIQNHTKINKNGYNLGMKAIMNSLIRTKKYEAEREGSKVVIESYSLSGAYWLRYGLLKSDLTMVSVNVVGVSLMLLYLLFYLYYSRPRTNFLLQLMMVQSLVAIMLVLVNIFGMDSIKFLGFVCMTFNIVNFGAPLAGMAVVLRNRSCSTLPLPLCTANLLVSSQWCIYGVCMDDIFIIIPNGCGVVLASFQICLFLIFPRTEGTHAPLAKCCPRLMDLEKGDGGLIGDNNSHGGKKAHKRENEYAHHRTLNPRNKFMHRQRVIDRRMIPASRAACIEFLRAGGAFDASFGSVSSRATQDSWMSGAGGNGNSTISRISSSLSHPELFATVQQADEQPCLYLQLGGGGNYGIDSNIGENSSSNRGQQPASTISIGPSTSLLSTTIGPMTPSFSASGVGLSVSRPAVCQEFGGIQEEIMIDENQLLTEERQPEGDLLFIRTLSAPDLLALLNRSGGNGNIGVGQS